MAQRFASPPKWWASCLLSTETTNVLKTSFINHHPALSSLDQNIDLSFWCCHVKAFVAHPASLAANKHDDSARHSGREPVSPNCLQVYPISLPSASRSRIIMYRLREVQSTIYCWNHISYPYPSSQLQMLLQSTNQSISACSINQTCA